MAGLAAAEPLAYKEDWPETRERMLALWEHEIIDRACIAVHAPRGDQVSVPEGPDPETEITDIDLHLARINALFRNTYYGGEAIPFLDSILGYAAYGGEPSFHKLPGSATNTVWIDPFIHDWEVDRYRFDPHNKWCQLVLEFKRREYEDSLGKYLPSMQGVLRPTEVLDMFRGSTGLCMDLYDHPDEVKATLRGLTDAWKWIYGQRFEIVHADEEGCAGQHVWAPGRYSVLGCDFSVNISAEQYREFVMPEIVEGARYLDYSFYHLDGPNATHHLPALFEIEDLNGIQFTIGAAHAHLPDAHWIPLYKRIQDAGKVVRIDARYDGVESLLSELDPRGIMIVTNAPSIEAADMLLRNVDQWTCRGVHTVSPLGGAVEDSKGARKS